MNNQLIQEYATLAEIAYKEYNANGEQNPIVDALIMKVGRVDFSLPKINGGLKPTLQNLFEIIFHKRLDYLYSEKVITFLSSQKYYLINVMMFFMIIFYLWYFSASILGLIFHS